MLARSNLGSVGDWRTAVPFAVRPTPETIKTCSDSTNYWLWSPGCWSYSLSDWQTMAQFKTPPAPPAVQAPADQSVWVKPPATGAAAEATIADVLKRQMSDWQRLNQQFFESQPYVKEPDDNSTLWLLAAVGVGAVSLFFIAKS